MKNFAKFSKKLISFPNLKNFVDLKFHKWTTIQGFDTLSVPIKLLETDLFLIDLMQKFNGYPVFLKMPKYSMYNWHKDLNRQVVVNSVVYGFDSYTMFTNDTLDQMNGTSTIVQELTYKERDCYLLNVQELHAVYNRSQDRIVISLSFDMPTTYEQILNYCIKNDYLEF